MHGNPIRIAVLTVSDTRSLAEDRSGDKLEELLSPAGHILAARDLAAAPWVRPSLVSPATMRFLGPGGAKDELVPVVRAEADAGATVLSLLLGGAGVGVLPEHALREHLHAGRLVRLCPGWIWKRVTLYALMPSRAAPGSALKAFLAMLVAEVERDRIRWATPAGEPS